MKKSLCNILYVSAFLIIFSGCASSVQIRHAYEGQVLPESGLSKIVYPGTGFFKYILYSVDRVPNLSSEPGVVWASYTSAANCGFEVLVPPGNHMLELYNVHSTPFDKDPLNYITIELATEAGKIYTMKLKDNLWTASCDGNNIPLKMGHVPVYIQVPQNEPYAEILVTRKNSPEGIPWLFRIDGMITPEMTYFEPYPRWVVINKVNKALRKLSADDGSISLRVKPGTHTIEYSPEYSILTKQFYGFAVRRENITLEEKQQAVLSLRQDGKTEDDIKLAVTVK